jgi:hypothetical protein
MKREPFDSWREQAFCRVCSLQKKWARGHAHCSSRAVR